MACSDPSRVPPASREPIMKRRVVAAVVTGTAVCALAWFASATRAAAGQNGQSGAPASAAAGPVPRLADGHPDLSGVWWGGADVGAARGGGPGRGGARGGARGTPPPTFPSLYQPS